MLEFVTSGLSVAISWVGCGQPSARASATAKTVRKRQKVAQIPLFAVITHNYACKTRHKIVPLHRKTTTVLDLFRATLPQRPKQPVARKNQHRCHSASAGSKFALWFFSRETLVRSAVIFVLLLLSLPNAASAGMLSLYSPFDKTHNGQNGSPSPPAASPPATGEALMGCGRGRYRDQVTHQCRGPGDLR
jgi:hypothetical protein